MPTFKFTEKTSHVLERGHDFYDLTIQLNFYLRCNLFISYYYNLQFSHIHFQHSHVAYPTELSS